MKILVVGGGAREHALCLALHRDPAVTALVCAPGNAGTVALAEARPLDVADPAAVAALALEVGADLVVVGPEVPLVVGRRRRRPRRRASPASAPLPRRHASRAARTSPSR